MAGSQKFSLRLSSKKKKGSSSTHSNTGGVESDDGYYTANGVQGKAGELLGTHRPSRHLTSKPSLASVAESEATNRSYRTAASGVETRQGLRQRPSSPLLHDKYVASNASSIPDRSIRERGSSSTLHSFYDPHKSPLYISQQTSESSARDFALRKGKPPVITQQHRPLMNKPSSSSLATSESPSAYHTEQKKRPNNIDLSRLFPRATRGHGPILSPHRYVDSPSALSTAGSVTGSVADSEASATSNEPTPKGRRMSRFGRTKPAQKSVPRAIYQNTEPDPRLSKVNVRRPRRGVQNWFDSLEGLSEEDEEELRALDEMQLNMKRQSAGLALVAARSSTGARSRPLSRKGSDAGTIQVVLDVQSHSQSPNRTRSRVPINQILSPVPSASSKNETPPASRGRSMSTRSRQSHTSTFHVANLTKDSVLALSSSDEDSESDHEEPLRSPVLRESVILGAYRDEPVEIGTAQIAKPSVQRINDQRLSPVISRPKRLTRFSSNFSDPSPPTVPSAPDPKVDVHIPEIPERHSSRLHTFLSQRPPSSPVQPAERSLPAAVPVPEDGELLSASTFKQQSVQEYEQLLERQNSTRVMRVTRQEESLLAAMRLKKANMRRAILTEAYHSALEEEEEAALALRSTIERPKTSRDSRTSIVDQILETEKRNSLAMQRPRTADGRQSLGPEDFSLLNTPLAPPFAPSLYHNSHSDAASSSRRDSIFQPDSLPSPTTGRASPVTPTIPNHVPPVLPVPIPGSRLSYPVHARRHSVASLHTEKRQNKNGGTTSQVRTILDDLDDAAEDAVSLDDFPIWAKGWVGDRPLNGRMTIVQ